MCWLIILGNVFAALSMLNALRVGMQHRAMPVPTRDWVCVLAVLTVCISGFIMLSGRKAGRWLYVASGIVAFVAINVNYLVSPIALFGLAVYAIPGAIFFSSAVYEPVSGTHARPKLRTIFGILFFILACMAFSLVQIAGFVPLPPSRFELLAKCIMVGVLVVGGAVPFFISIWLEKIRSVVYHAGLVLLGATCLTVFLALCFLASAMTPEPALSLKRVWPALLNANFNTGALLCAFTAILGALMVFLPRGRGKKSSTTFMTGGLATAGLLFVGAAHFAKPVWLGCVGDDPYQAVNSCSGIIAAGHEGGNSLGLAYRLRGVAYMRLNQPDAALSDETNAIRLRHDDAAAYMARAYLYNRRNEPQDAIADYTSAIALNPHLAGAYVERGNVYNQLSLWPKAIADYSMGIRLEPMNEYIFIERGYAYASEGHWTQSVADDTKAIALSPGDDIAWNNRCFGRANMGDLQPALADCNRAIKIGPNYDYSYNSRGFVYLRLKDYDAAISDYTLALMAAPDSANSLYGKSIAEKAAGYETDSEADLAKAKSINPGIAAQFAPHMVEK